MADSWRTIVAASLDWEQAHASFASAVDGLPPKLRGRRPKQYPHSAWELVEHLRLAEADLLAFMTKPKYVAPKWPDDYWPATPAPPSGVAWGKSVRAVQRDCRALQRLTRKKNLDLTRRIPWGEGQTYLRTILLAMDHMSYHVGQLIAVRRLLADWP